MGETGYPLVPCGDHDEFRIDLQCVVPLFLEIESAPDGIDGRILLALVETSPPRLAGPREFHRPGFPVHVLRGGYIDLLGNGGIVGEAIGLRMDSEPVPSIRRVFVRRCARPESSAEGEMFSHLRHGCVRVAEEQRLAVPMEPEFVKATRKVEFLEQLARDVTHVRVEHETDLRGASALPAYLQEHRQKLVEDILVEVGVGRVEHQGVDTGRSKEVHVAPDDPRISQFIIAKKRFAPVSHVPLLRSGMLETRRRPHVRLFGKNLAHIVRTVAVFVACPCGIKNANEAVFFRRPDLGGERKLAAQSVRRRPRDSGIDGLAPRGGADGRRPCRRQGEQQGNNGKKAGTHRAEFKERHWCVLGLSATSLEEKAKQRQST